MVYRKNQIYFIFLFLFSFSLLSEAVGDTSPHHTVVKLINSISNLKTNGHLSPKELKTNQDLSYRALSLLDIKEVGRKALGKYWTKRTPKEQKRFIYLLSQMFVEEAFPNSGKFFSTFELIFGKTKINKLKARVPLTVIHEKEGKIAIDFHLHKNKDEWQVVDVDLDEISMRNNLRTQVYKIISKNNYRELVRRMEEKLKESNS